MTASLAAIDGQTDAERYADHVLGIPSSDDHSGAVLANVQLQVVFCWVANRLGRRQAAESRDSVTVE